MKTNSIKNIMFVTGPSFAVAHFKIAQILSKDITHTVIFDFFFYFLNNFEPKKIFKVSVQVSFLFLIEYARQLSKDTPYKSQT